MKPRPNVVFFHACFGKLLLLVLGVFLGSGCGRAPQTMSTPLTSPSPTSATAELNRALSAAAAQTSSSMGDYRVAAEDSLQITLYNVPEDETGVTPRRQQVRVSQDGKIPLALLGDIQAAGLTPAALEHVLRERYEQYLKNPQVGVLVSEYRGQRVSVMGAVQKPGVFELTGPKTLVDVLALAGGLDDKQASSQVQLYRQTPEGRKIYVIDLQALARNPGLVNMPIQAGDALNVPRAGMFFVDGAIGNPGSYPLSRPYTLTQALAMAGGVKTTLADYESIAIFRRRDAAEADKLSINLKDILAGTATDPLIHADDVIVIPMSTAKYIVERFIGTIGLPSLTPW